MCLSDIELMLKEAHINYLPIGEPVGITYLCEYFDRQNCLKLKGTFYFNIDLSQSSSDPRIAV